MSHRKKDSTSRRRFIKTAGAGTVLFTGLSGCSGSGTNKQGGQGGTPTPTDSSDGGDGGSTGGPKSHTLEIWLAYIAEGGRKRDITKKWFKKYEENNPVTFNLKGVPYEQIPKKLQAARAAGNPPHLVETSTRPHVLAGGVSKDYSQFWGDTKTSDIIDDSLMELMGIWSQQLVGKQTDAKYIWPIAVRPYFPIYTQSWIDSSSLSRPDVDYRSSHTFSDMFDKVYPAFKQSSMGQKKGHYPSSWGLKPGDHELMVMKWLPAFGNPKTGVINDAGTEAAFDTEGTKQFYEHILRGLDKGYLHSNLISHGDEEGTTLQWSGKLAENTMQDSSDAWSGYLREKPDLMKPSNLGYAWGTPAYEESTGKRTAAWLQSVGFVSGGWESDTHLQKAVEFLDTWTSDPEWMFKLNTQGLGFVPFTPSIIKEKDWFTKSKLHEQFWSGAVATTLDEYEFTTVPAVPGAGTIIREIPNKASVWILQQDMSIDKAIKQAHKEINQFLESKGRR